MSSWWRYRGRCIGRVLHFLYHYCGFDVAEHAVVGNEEVILRGKRIATFAWSFRFGEQDAPEFTFLCEDAEQCAENQRTKREAAILDALPDLPPPDARRSTDEEVLLAIIPGHIRAIRLCAGRSSPTRTPGTIGAASRPSPRSRPRARRSRDFSISPVSSFSASRPRPSSETGPQEI